MISENLEFRMHNYYNAQCVMGVLALIVKKQGRRVDGPEVVDVVWGDYLTMTLLEVPSRVTM